MKDDDDRDELDDDVRKDIDARMAKPGDPETTLTAAARLIVMTRGYDSTVARIAGNIAAGLVRTPGYNGRVAEDAVELARAIVAEVRRTEPEHAEGRS